MQFSTPRENNREREEFKIRVLEGRSSSTMLSTSDVGIGSVVSLNTTKTEFMLIGSRQRLSTLTESPTFAINDFEVS